MLSIDLSLRDIVVATPDRHGGVARMLAILENAGLGVSRIEPRIGQSGTYHVTIEGSPEAAVRILEAIGCQVAPLHRRDSS